MKKIVLFLAMLLTETCLKAQTAEGIAVFKRFKNRISQAQENARAGIYARAESKLRDWLELTAKQH